MLVEANGSPTVILTFAYVARALAQHHSSGIAAFVASRTQSFGLPPSIYWLARHMYWLLVSPHQKNYRAFGARGLIHPRESRRSRTRAEQILREFQGSKPSKRNLERLEVDGLLVGDLFYDTFLRSRKAMTVDMNSKDFLNFLRDSIAHTVFWLQTMKSGQVNSVLVSHGVYNMAIPLRAALHCGIPGYLASGGHVIRLSADKPRSREESRDFRKLFGNLPLATQADGLQVARARIASRFKGEVDVDMLSSKTSSFTAPRSQRLLSSTKTAKVLVSMHCFSDAPHAYGENLFPDFWEWLLFLGKTTSETEFEWYLKPHPDCVSSSEKAIQDLVRLFPGFTPLPAASSHHQLVSEGVTAALTVYGTLGFEYALFGIPVINASRVNPHIAYSFNYHPKTVEEYEQLIRNIPHLARPSAAQREEAVEYYFMRHVYCHSKNIFGADLADIRRRRAKGDNRKQDFSLGDFLSEWNSTKHEETMSALAKFIRSGKRGM